MLQPRDLRGRRAVSYARWSSGRQAQGDSLRRQTENAARFCDKYGLELDREGSFIDDGVSAFKGANLEANLGVFIKDVEVGRISPDIVLLMENLDRFSRINPMDVVPRFIDLLRTGLTLVTLQDGRVHSLEDYTDNTMNLMMSIMGMQAAHEYSKKLSDRVSASWDSRAEKARKGRIPVSKVPFWIDRETQGLNGRADDARLIFRLAEEGAGQASIVRHLNEKGIAASQGGKWEKSMVQATLKSRVAYGSLMVRDDEVHDYFPAIVAEAQWLAIQNQLRDRSRNPQAQNSTNLFARLLRCHHCGHPINVSTTKQKGQSYRYMVCSGKAFKRTDCTAPNWRYETFEEEFISRLGLLAIPTEPSSADGDLKARQASLRGAVAVLENKQANLVAAVGEAETRNIRLAFTTQADAVSREIDAKRDELRKVLESAARYAVGTGQVDDIEAARTEITRLAKEDRSRARYLIGSLVERIDLEVDSGHLRFAHVKLRNWAASHTIGFDTSGEI